MPLLWWVAHQALAGEVDVRWGPVARVREDAVFSHVAYAGVSPIRLGVGVGFGERVRHRAELGVDLTSVRAGRPYEATRTDGPDFVVAGSPFARVGVSWSSTWAVGDALRVGFAAEPRIDTTSYDHGFNGVFGYMAIGGLGPAASASWSLADGLALEVGGSVPVLAWVARSPYAMNDDAYIRAIASHRALPMFGALIGDGSLRTVGTLQMATARTDLRGGLGEGWDLVGRVEVSALRYALPRPVADLSVTAEAGVARVW